MVHAQEDRRHGVPPVPHDYKAILSDGQRQALRTVEQFGWELVFVRRPMFEPVVAVARSSDGRQYGLLTDEGVLDTQTRIHLRH